jgi:hypothetical protein
VKITAGQDVAFATASGQCVDVGPKGIAKSWNFD